MSDKHKPWHDAHRQKSRGSDGDGKPAAKGDGKSRSRDNGDSKYRQYDNHQDESYQHGKQSRR
jgi:hypothetical protein